MEQNIPIFLSSDNNYAPFIATTIASVLDNTKSFIEFYVLDGGITEENKEKISALQQKFNNFKIEFIKIDLEKHFKNVKTRNYVSLSAFNKLLIPNQRPEIKKAIYIDADAILLDDIKKLYEQNLDNYIIGAVQDICQAERNKAKELIGMYKDSVYFNSGVLLIDCEKWRNIVDFEDLLCIEEKTREKRLFNDQDIFNKYFENNYKLLDDEFNVIEPRKNTVIRHFAGNTKPWHFDENIKTLFMPNISDFWKYAKMSGFEEEINKFKKNENEQKMLLRNLQIGAMIRNADKRKVENEQNKTFV